MTKNMPESRVETILVRCPNWVGDIVMATPTFGCLRENFPGAKMVGLIRKRAKEILKDGPWFDGFIDCEDKSWSGLRRTARQIRTLKPDIAIVLPNSIRSALTVRLGGAKRTYGYRRSGRGILLTGGPEPKREGGKIVPMPMVEYYLEICRWLGLETPASAKPSLYVGADLRRKAALLFEKYGIEERDMVIGLNPGASFGSSKCWPAEHFAALAELIEGRLNAKILLLSGPGEESIVQAIMSQTHARIIDTGPDKIDLALLKPVIRRCDLLITNDTGPRHYAVAFDVPVVVIMGPTDPRYTAASLEKTMVIRKDLDCSPCHKKVCPTDHRCMTEITPDMVFEQTMKLLKVNEKDEAVGISKTVG
jgi:heptosyltransferase-2